MQTFKSKNSFHSAAVQTDNTSLEKDTLGTKLQKELNLRTDFEKIAQKLNDYEQTEKFVKCISALSKGSLAFTNMAWKSFLEMGSLLSCSSTTRMEHDKEWLEFCQVLSHIFSAGVINALRGRGHFSQVKQKRKI